MSDSFADGARALRPGIGWLWGVPVAAVVALAAILLGNANADLFLALNNGLQAPGPAFWSCITILGDTLVAAVLVLPLVRRRSDILWALLLACVVATLFTHTLKPLLDIRRPAGVLESGLFTVIGPALKRHSFPSGHTVTVFTTTGVVALMVSSVWTRVGLVCAAALIGISRVAVGAHWPADIAAGALFGWVSAVAGVWLAAKWRVGRFLAFQIFAGVVLAAACVVLGTVHRTRYPDALWFQRGLAVVFLAWGLWDLTAALRSRGTGKEGSGNG